MTISSRTPEGDPNGCPICGQHVRLEPSIDTRDAPCPHCGHLIWFPGDVTIDGSGRTDKWAAKEDVLTFATKRFGPPPESVQVALSGLESSKFEKVDLARLLRAKNWPEVVAMIKTANH